MSLTDSKRKDLELKANQIRQSIIEMLVSAGSGHTAGPLGMSDIFSALFFEIIKHDTKKPDWEERDRFVLSNGHICPVYYATLAHCGYFPVKELLTLRKFGSKLQGHPHRDFLSILETSSGPLGSGLSQLVGMALADRIDNTDNSSDKFFYGVLSDGEMNEGQTWEACMLAGKEKLWNLICFIDRNNIQIDGFTEDIMPLEPFADKWRAWNWHVIEIDGHNMDAIVDAVNEGKAIFDKPTMIIANTIPGKGVKEFERKPEWHGKPPTSDEGEMALHELREIQKTIENS